jgi:hypothetical protein
MEVQVKIEFSVANAMKSLVSTNAEINGEQQKVLADGLEVELVPVASAHGSLMLRFIGKDATEAAGLFQKDHKVSFECKND